MRDQLKLIDLHPHIRSLHEEVVEGLTQPRKQLSPKLFYDERGSQLFAQICELDAYYVTRTETRIMRDFVDEMVSRIGPRALLIEYGSGTSEKTRVLLDNIIDPAGYVPIDISKEHLMQSAEAIANDYPEIAVLPVCADYNEEFELPDPPGEVRNRVTYFPGSTIGNFHPDEAVDFLRRAVRHANGDTDLLIGVDLKKDPALINRAYNDSEGVTAQFNKNMLVRINRELGTDFDPITFRHHAFYNETAGRVEMHLVSERAQSIDLDGLEVHFDAGESIWTESSYKYTVDEFSQLTAKAGFTLANVWTDPSRLFSVQYHTL